MCMDRDHVDLESWIESRRIFQLNLKELLLNSTQMQCITKLGESEWYLRKKKQSKIESTDEGCVLGCLFVAPSSGSLHLPYKSATFHSLRHFLPLFAKVVTWDFWSTQNITSGVSLINGSVSRASAVFCQKIVFSAKTRKSEICVPFNTDNVTLCFL